MQCSNLAMRTEVIDQALLDLQGTAGLSVQATASSSSGLPTGVSASMLLPPTLNLTTGVTVAAVNYGKYNPYEEAGGPLTEGASINSFTLNGMEVKDLTDPIVLALPLPSSRRRLLEGGEERHRRLGGSWNGSYWGTKDFAESYSVDCGAENITRTEALYTMQDLARAQFCGTESDLENQTKQVSYLQPWRNASKYVWCSSIEEWHYLDCEGRRGVINYTCPVYYSASTCSYWDESTLSWKDDGCTYWRTDLKMGVAYCNCTHLTSFTSDHTRDLFSSAGALTKSFERTSSLNGKDIQRNIGILIFILAIWGISLLVYFFDKIVWRLKLMDENISERGYQDFLVVRSMIHPEGRNPWQAARKKVLTVENSAENVQFVEQLRRISPPAFGTLYSAVSDMQRAQEEIEFEARSLIFQLEGKRKIWRNWIDKMLTEHDFIFLLNPTSYQRDIFAKRTVIGLFNIFSLLFLMCLFTPPNPEGFLCPSEGTPTLGGAGLLPSLPSGLSFAQACKWTFLKGAKVLTNLLYLVPPRMVLKHLLGIWEGIRKTQTLHFERLVQIKERHKLLRPLELHDQVDLCVTLNMLHSAKHTVERLSAVLRWRQKYLEWPTWRREMVERRFGITVPSHELLQSHWDDLSEFEDLINQAIFEARSQIDHLDGVAKDEKFSEKVAKKNEKESDGPLRGVRRGALKLKKSNRNDLEMAFAEAAKRPQVRQRHLSKKIPDRVLKHRSAEAALASLPQAVQW